MPKGIPNSGLSHGVIVLVGGSPWSAALVDVGLQCHAIHPRAMTDALPVVCACCGQGTPAADHIAARIDYGARATEEPSKVVDAAFRPHTRGKYRLQK